jgi:hypothetical protein
VETGNQSWRFKQSSNKAKIAAGVATPVKQSTKTQMLKTLETKKGESTPTD